MIFFFFAMIFQKHFLGSSLFILIKTFLMNKAQSQDNPWEDEAAQ